MFSRLTMFAQSSCFNFRLRFVAGLAAVFVALGLSTNCHADTIDLSGTWQVRWNTQLNVLNSAEAETPVYRQDPVTLPGTMRDSQLGFEVGPTTPSIGQGRPSAWKDPKYDPYRGAENFKYPFWWQANRRYIGSATYQREINIPADWQQKRIILHLERPHWRTVVRLNGKEIGQNDSMGTPHEYDLTDLAKPGKHQLSIEVDNTVNVVDVGVNSHSVSDHTQTAWHGIVGAIKLLATPKLAVTTVQIFPAADCLSAKVKVQVANSTDQLQSQDLTCKITQQGQLLGEVKIPVEITPGQQVVQIDVPLEQAAKRWDEFNPNLCRAEIALDTHTHDTVFGFRSITQVGRDILLNGSPIFLRGTLECCIFPEKGYPATDVDSWKRIIRICKAHGLNHIRFHSWCPPKAAFVAADQMGFYYQVECSTWPNQSVKLGQGKPVDQWIYREGDRVVQQYANHPSFILLAAGNEPSGGEFLGPWVEQFKQDRRHLVTSSAGWPELEPNQFHVITAPRLQQWGENLDSRINARPPETLTNYDSIIGKYNVPIVAHEIGQWCAFPNFAEIEKYKGSIQLKNFEVFRDLLTQAGLASQANDFLMASGKLQAMAYKEEIEASLRTPNYGGFQLLDLRDFPGQGTALVGVLDPFWDSKPYISPNEYARFCGPHTLLAKLDRRVWTTDQTLVADLQISHFGPESLKDAVLQWQLKDATGNVVTQGKLPAQDITRAGLRDLGRVEINLAEVLPSRDKAAHLNLEVELQNVPISTANDWDLWVYPTATDSPANSPQIVTQLDDDAVERLKQGETLWLMANPKQIKTDVKIGFSPIFWNTAWTSNQPPHTLGILCDPKHPALQDFPTDYHSDWQWWELILGSAAMPMDGLASDIQPLIQVVPDWFDPQRLGLAWEAKIGSGKLLVTSMDLTNSLSDRPVARQMRLALSRYLASPDFAPEHEVQVEKVRGLFRELSWFEKIGASATASSQQEGYPAALAIDDDPSTIWHTAWAPSETAYPHSLTVDLKQSYDLAGISCLPRKGNANGRIREYRVEISTDGQTWQQVAQGQWKRDRKAKQVSFGGNRQARYVRLWAVSSFNGNAFASLAELKINPAAPSKD